MLCPTFATLSTDIKKGPTRLSQLNPSTYNGYHVTNAYYSQGYADGSLFGAIQQSSQPQTPCPTGASQFFNQSFWQSLMSAQQNLFSGWTAFGGQPNAGTCPSRPPTPTPAAPCSRQRINIHHHYHFYAQGCGGPFTAQGGQGSAAVSQSHGAFGSHGAASQWQSSAFPGCYSPFQPGPSSGFGFGSYGCLPQPMNFMPSFNANLFGSVGQFGQMLQPQNGCAPLFPMPQLPQMPTPQYPEMPIQSYNWNDFQASFSNSNSPFGVLPSAYAGYAMTSPFTSFGTSAGLALLGGALSLFF